MKNRIFTPKLPSSENSCFTYPAVPTRWLCKKFKILCSLLNNYLRRTYIKIENTSLKTLQFCNLITNLLRYTICKKQPFVKKSLLSLAYLKKTYYFCRINNLKTFVQ